MPEPILEPTAEIGAIGAADRYRAEAGVSLAPQYFVAPAVGILSAGGYSDPLRPAEPGVHGPAVVVCSTGQTAPVEFAAAESRFYWPTHERFGAGGSNPVSRAPLRRGGEPVISPAHRHGFSDRSNLCRRFRRYFAVSPGRFRKRDGAGA